MDERLLMRFYGCRRSDQDENQEQLDNLNGTSPQEAKVWTGPLKYNRQSINDFLKFAVINIRLYGHKIVGRWRESISVFSSTCQIPYFTNWPCITLKAIYLSRFTKVRLCHFRI